jgi:ATP-dependent RNA helicase DeaD
MLQTKDAMENEQEAAGGFGNLGLDPKLVSTLGELGYEEPTPIQRETIPPLLTGRDLIGQAATGTGKTAAFALPMIQRIAESGAARKKPSAMILVPTRELAMQVAEAMHKYGQKLKVSTIPIYGGHSFGAQARMLERGVDIIVATPGRAVDHITRKTLDLSSIRILVLDEADEMLDMGFAEDLETILSQTPSERQTVFFSATLPPRIAGMVKRHQKDPLRIEIAKEKMAKGSSPKVRQTAYLIPRARKLETLGRVLDLENPSSALVFCRMRTDVDTLTERLSAHGYRAQSLHGGITQDQRTRVIKRLREGAIDLVVATDVAARGLDIENLELVVNYDVPTSPDSYVHRIGRVGRAGREGIAITLADPRESRLLRLFEQVTKSKIEIAQVPTIADLRAKRLELTRSALHEAILAGGLDHYRVAVEALAQEHDLMTVALAAVKLAHQATGGDPDGEDEPDGRPDGRAEQQQQRDAKPARSDRPDRGSHAQPSLGRTARIYVGAGRLAGIQPKSLVGAITGESGITGKQIGAIEIADRFSIVELAEDVVDDVLQAMRTALIRGKKVPVRRFVEKQ